MDDRSRFSGMHWHTEFQSARKKEKAADCIYLNSERICNCKQCYHYLAKCFAASNCKYRIKEAESRSTETQCDDAQKSKDIVSICCSLPIYCEVKNKFGTVGKLIAYDSDSMVITIQYETKTVKYHYPQVFTEGFLFVQDDLKKFIEKDIKRAVRR